MESQQTNTIAEVLRQNKQELLEQWLKEQLASSDLRLDLISESELISQSHDFLDVLENACQLGNLTDITTGEWATMRKFLEEISRKRAAQGFSPSEMASFILSFKSPLTNLLRDKLDVTELKSWEVMWAASMLLDKLGLFITDAYISSREAIIKRQQYELIELSRPVVEVWEGVLVLPIIGTLDSARTQMVMENLLQSIVETSSEIAIIDITGVPTVDTSVAQHLMKTVTAARLMGARCIISGVRPQIAQTMVNLGVTFSDITTRASLSDALAEAFELLNLQVTRINS